MRRKKHLDARTAACLDLLVEQPENCRGKWLALTGGRPIHLEIGCGKGGFVVQSALENPDCFFVALEREPNVLLLALERAKAEGVNNLLFIRGDANQLGGIFGPGEVERLYLNFSDPWPQNRNAKRRLTHPNLLRLYRELLIPGGEIQMKTDNPDLFAYSVCQLSQNGFILDFLSLDLHRTGESNIMTEYERRFAEQGIKINKLIARKGE